MVTPGNVWYLVGFDLDRDDWRLFRVDRITDVVWTGHGATERQLPGGDPAAFLERSIATMPMAHRATVIVPMGFDALRAARPDLLVSRITASGRRRCQVALAADHLDVLIVQIAELIQVAEGCTVDADPVVQDHLDALAARLRSSIA